ncbi:MAG TPA: ABC transporter permease subunit [Anaerolineales bacterium]|nr:ABC transporter permease subunit [Anaerolineales bacterium]
MTSDPLVLARKALNRGETNTARRLVARVLVSDPTNEQAWLLMARLAGNRDQVIESLERASRINPHNLSTQTALQAMRRGQARSGHRAAALPLTRPVGTASRVPLRPIVAVEKKAPETLTFALPEEAAEALQLPKRKINRSMMFGSLIVLIIIVIALIGPSIAPQDPMEEHAVIQVAGKWIIPPFNALQVPGFVLGSDQFGRDMLSRLLYAIRPTLVMVTIVAVVRLLIGTLIGLGAGWFRTRFGRVLDGLISAALAVPILLVALGAITMLGAETGLVAFIVGLSINGWGETARLVRQQTELIKGQLFIESARSLGASAYQILFRHILRQIMSMVWMLFAFEISSTLMVTAGLGFLGYYIGGDVWIEVADFVSRRTSGAPELGQMLATSWVNLLQPWPLVLTGSVVFFTILGFNLLGEGLRLRLSPEYINRSSLVARFSHRFRLWFEESISYPVSNWLGANRLRPVFVGMLIVALGGSLYYYQAILASRFNRSQAVIAVPGGQIWASERIDPYGTYYQNSIGPSRANKLWQMNDFAGLTGNPAIAADGTVYVAGLDSKLIAMNPDGSLRWQADTPLVPMGSPAIAPNGAIYLTDEKGGLSGFSVDGALLWTYPNEAYGRPTHGAIVAPNGTIYYLLQDPRGDTLIALTAGGQLLWSAQPGLYNTDSALRLSSDGQKLFVKDRVVNTSDGTVVDLPLPTDNSPTLGNHVQLFVGADGKTYLLAGHLVIEWTQTAQGFNQVSSANWDFRSAGLSQTSGFPVDAGVTPDGNIWLYYTGNYSNPTIYWLRPNGNIIGAFSAPIDQIGVLVAIDGNKTTYICGMGYVQNQPPAAMCEAYRQNSTDAEWTFFISEAVDHIVGAAMAPGRLYIITPDGTLTAIGDATTPPPTASPTP